MSIVYNALHFEEYLKMLEGIVMSGFFARIFEWMYMSIYMQKLQVIPVASVDAVATISDEHI